MTLNRSNPLANGTHRRAIGTFPNRAAAEQALHELRDSGYAMDQVSVVAQNTERNETIAGADVRTSEDDRRDNKADDGAKVGGVSGSALGGLTGLLVGIGTLAIPGVGPVMLAGAAATAIATTLAGTAIGAAAGSLLGGLIGLGIPEDRAKVYSDRVSAGEYLVMVDGTDEEIARAEAILSHRGVSEWGIYDIPAATLTDRSAPVESGRVEGLDRVQTAAVTPPISPMVSTPGLADRVSEVPVSSSDPETIRLYEERLIADKDREKTGEVSIGKRVEVETARVSLPLEKERILIERVPGNTDALVAPSDAFQEQTVRVEAYEEVADIRKEAFVREEVNIRKEVDQEMVNVEEELRRETLSVDTQGKPVVDDRI